MIYCCLHLKRQKYPCLLNCFVGALPAYSRHRIVPDCNRRLCFIQSGGLLSLASLGGHKIGSQPSCRYEPIVLVWLGRFLYPRWMFELFQNLQSSMSVSHIQDPPKVQLTCFQRHQSDANSAISNG